MTSELDLGNNIFCLVDDEDFKELSKFRWVLYKGNTKRPTPAYYVGRSNGNLRPSPILMHRQIMGFPQSGYCDHINGNTLDNRKENLRLVTNSINQFNRHNFIENKTGYPGVKKTKWGTFETRIRILKKTTHLGTFPTAEEAGKCYKEAILRISEENFNGMGSGDSTHVCNLK